MLLLLLVVLVVLVVLVAVVVVAAAAVDFFLELWMLAYPNPVEPHVPSDIAFGI